MNMETLARFSLAELLNSEQTLAELEEFSQLSNSAIALYSLAQKNIWLAAGPENGRSLLENFCQETVSSSKYLVDNLCDDTVCLNVDQQKIYLVPLVAQKKCWGYLLLVSTEFPEAAPLFRLSLEHQIAEALQNFSLRKQIQKLEEDANLFRVIFEEAPYAITISRLRDSIYLAVNPAYCDSWEVTADQLINHSAYLSMPPDQAEKYAQFTQMILQQGRIGPVEVKSQRPNGDIADVLLAAKTVEVNGEPCVLALTINITEQKRAQAALRESEERFRGIFENSPLPIIIARLTDNKHVQANPAFYRLTGYEPADIIGQDTRLTIPAANLSEQPKIARGLREEGRLDNILSGLIYKDGSIHQVLFSSVLLKFQNEPHVISITTDISERLRAEEALRANEERYRLVAEFTGQLHYDLDLKSGALKWAGRVHDITGFSHEEMNQLGASGWEELVHPADRQALLEVLDAVQVNMPLYHCEYRLRRTDDVYINIEDEGTVFYNEQGQPCRRLGVCKDITSRKQSEYELQQRNEELMRFNYTASHDLRTPLITIKSFLGLLEKEMAIHSNERLAKHFEYINKAAQKMTALLDELLQLSRIGRMINPSTEFTLQEVVQEALQLIQGRLSNLVLDIIITQEPLILYGDRQRIVELFQNLLDNAIKFMGPQNAPRIEVGTELLGNEWSIFVRDNGLGIDPRFQHKIFDLFEKLDPEIEGTGIGLALVKRIIEVHRGKISVSSKGLGHGCTFYFSLPHTKHL